MGCTEKNKYRFYIWTGFGLLGGRISHFYDTGRAVRCWRCFINTVVTSILDVSRALCRDRILSWWVYSKPCRHRAMSGSMSEIWIWRAQCMFRDLWACRWKKGNEGNGKLKWPRSDDLSLWSSLLTTCIWKSLSGILMFSDLKGGVSFWLYC